MTRAPRVIVLLAALALPALASAVVVASGPAGFLLREEVVYPGPPAAAWQRLVQPALWWSADHTYSGSAANLSLTLSRGGCWCESLPDGGFVRHMDVLFASAPKLLRLGGGLGPLQGMGVSGALTFVLKPEGAGATRIVVEYAVSGFAVDGLQGLAAGVDQVLGAQVSKLGSP